MATQSKTYTSVDEYLKLEEQSRDRHEYLNGEVFLMAGGTPDHSAIGSNIIIAIGSQLVNSDCVVRGPDAHIRTSSSGLYSYADAVVSCGERQVENNFLINPVLIIEVLSESSESYDRGKKFELYRQIESFNEYMIAAPDRIYVEHHVRDERDPTKWTMQLFTDLHATIHLRSVSAVLRLSDVYAKINFT